MFRLAFLVAFLFLVWLESLFTQTVHVIDGKTHLFKYNGIPWLFLVLMSLVLVGFAEIARRFQKDRVTASICLLGLPFFAFVSLQLLYERVEVTDSLLVHRREWPQTQYNADISWDSIQSATKIEREKPGLLAPNYYHVGYEFTLKGGRLLELPSNTVLTSAQEEIDRKLALHKIPQNTQKIPMPK
jgi:hypothetical protein